MAIVGLLLILAFFGITWWVREKQRRDRAAQDQRDGVFAVFSGLRLTRYGDLIVGYGLSSPRHSVTGMSARCETSGSVNRVKGKRIDDRSVTLTVEGPRFVAVREVPMRHAPTLGVNARVFASQVTEAGQRSYPLRTTARARPLAAAPAVTAPEVHFNHGLRLQKEGNLVAAQDAYRWAAASGHQEAAPRAALNLGVLLNRQGDRAGAQAAFQHAMDSSHPDAGPIAALNLGDVLRDLGDQEGARAAYRRAAASGHPNAGSKAADRLSKL